MNAKRLTYLALLTAALTTAVLYLVGTSNSHRHNASASSNKLATSFRIFRAPIDILPQAEARRIGASAESIGLVELANTHLAVTEQGRLWVFRVGRQVCLGNTRGVACASSRKAMRTGVVLGVFDPPDRHRRTLHNFLLQGIAPDDVSQVEVLIDNRRSLTVDVVGSVFSVAANQPIHLKRLLRD